MKVSMFPDPAVAVGVNVAVFTGTPVVGVGVRVGVFVGVRVGEGVAETVGAAVPSVTTSCGASAPSRAENTTPSLLSATKAKEYVPLAVTKAVTSYSTQELAAITALLSDAPLKSAGCVSQVTPPVPDSIQLLAAK